MLDRSGATVENDTKGPRAAGQVVSGVSVGALEEPTMTTLVTCVSRTGNTRKVAEAIFDGITGDKDMKELRQVESLDCYDLTFVGFPIEERFSPAEPAASSTKTCTIGLRRWGPPTNGS